MQYYFLAWKLSLNFSGRSSREAFWMFMLVHILITIGFITASITMDIKVLSFVDIIYDVISFVPMLSIIARRLHDIDKSGYWGLVFFIPAVGPFGLVYLLVKSTKNRRDGETLA